MNFTIMEEIVSFNNDEKVLSDLKYICKSSMLITDALQKGFDVTQMPNGDVIVTEVKTINVHYSWDSEKNKMVRVSTRK